MTTIRLLDARRGLNRKCEELFGNAKIAEAIYRYLCDGIEECEDAEPERKKGKWIYEGIRGRFPACKCSICGSVENADWAVVLNGANFCPNCGADMREEAEDSERIEM